MAKPSTAWGHQIELPSDDRTYHGRSMGQCATGMRCPNRVLKEAERSPITGNKYGNDYYVGGPAVFVGYYRYVSGRAGNVTTRELPMCVDCATKFAAKHKLTLPPLSVTSIPPAKES